jgi:hypothetical protein
LFLRWRKRKADEGKREVQHAELPSYQDSKDAAAVEAPAGPLEFAPYRPREPAEMAAGEEVDQFPTGDEEIGNSEVGSGLGLGMGSPGLRSESRVSEVSDASVSVQNEGRFSRGSGSGTVSPHLGMGETPEVVRRKPVGT